MNISMLHDNVLIQLVDEDVVKQVGTLYVPDNAQEAPQTARVIAVGSGRWLYDRSQFIPTTVQNGDKVIYPKYSGVSTQIEGQSYIIVRETELLAVLESDEQSDLSDQSAHLSATSSPVQLSGTLQA